MANSRGLCPWHGVIMLCCSWSLGTRIPVQGREGAAPPGRELEMGSAWRKGAQGEPCGSVQFPARGGQPGEFGICSQGTGTGGKRTASEWTSGTISSQMNDLREVVEF